MIRNSSPLADKSNILSTTFRMALFQAERNPVHLLNGRRYPPSLVVSEFSPLLKLATLTARTTSSLLLSGVPFARIWTNRQVLALHYGLFLASIRINLHFSSCIVCLHYHALHHFGIRIRILHVALWQRVTIFSASVE